MKLNSVYKFPINSQNPIFHTKMSQYFIFPFLTNPLTFVSPKYFPTPFDSTMESMVVIKVLGFSKTARFAGLTARILYLAMNPGGRRYAVVKIPSFLDMLPESKNK